MDKIPANEGVISTAASRVAVSVIQWGWSKRNDRNF